MSWLYSISGQATPHTVRARQLTVKDGLSSNVVNSVMKDSKGFIWVGTRNGLNKYDGYKFRQYFHKPFDSNGLQSNVIRDVVEDRSGTIWLATADRGLAKLDRRTDQFTHYRCDPNNPHSIGSDNVTGLFLDSKGRLWIGLENGELDYFNVRTETFQRFSFPGYSGQKQPKSDIRSIVEDKNGLLYCQFQHTGKTIVLDPQTGRWLKQHWLCKILVTSDRSVWLLQTVNKDSVFEYSCHVFPGIDEIRHNEAFVLPVNPAINISKNLIDKGNGTFWSIALNGIVAIDTLQKTSYIVEVIAPSGRPLRFSNPGTCIQDGEGSLWVATEQGLLVLESERKKIHTYEPPDEPERGSGSIRGLAFDKYGCLWAGTSNGFLYQFDPSLSVLVKKDLGFRPPSVNHIMFDSAGLLWVIGRGITASVSTNTNRVIPKVWSRSDRFPETPHSLFIDKQGIVWIGTIGNIWSDGGLYRVDPHTGIVGKYTYLSQAGTLDVSRFVGAIVPQGDNALWIGTSHGLFLFDKKEGFLKRYAYDLRDSTSISSDKVWVVHRDKRGRLWIGTWGGGLNCLDEDLGVFSHYTTQDGLPSNVIQSILEDDNGNLWIATSNGISCFNTTTKTFKNFTTDDGLLDAEYEPNAAAISPKGELFFGGYKGISSFYASDLLQERARVPIVVTALKVFDKLRKTEAGSGEIVELPYYENYFTVEFASLDFRDPAQKRYEYMLEGQDVTWISSGNRNSASYNDIAPGEYTFHVRLKDQHGLNEYKMILIIHPPYWATLWFRSTILLLIVGSMGYVLQRRNIKRRQFHEHLESAREEERLGLAGELHDGPLQDMYAARFILEPLADEISTPEGKTKAAKLHTIIVNVRKDLQLVTGRMQMPRFDLGLAEELRVFAGVFSELHPDVNVHTSAITRETAPLGPKVMQNFYRIARTAFGNIEKHSQATEVWISFAFDGKKAIMSIADNGRGFAIPHQYDQLLKGKHYGLFLIQSYAAAIGADVAINSAPGKGCKVGLQYTAKRPIFRKFKS